MKTIILIQIALIILFKPVNAGNDWIIKAGFNYSKLRAIKNEPHYGISIGVERKIPVWGLFSINPEIIFFRQGGTIKDKPVWTDLFNINNTLYNYDIKITGGGLEIAPVFDFQLWENESFLFNGRIYPAYHFGAFTAELKEKNRIDTNNGNIDWNNYDFEYREGDFDNWFNFKTGWSMNFGITIKYRIYLLELRYIHNMYNIGQAGDLYPLSYKISSLHLLLGLTI